MAEESDLERTEPASARRLEQAREEGQVPRSREVGAFLILIVAATAFWLMGPWMVQRVAGNFPARSGFRPRSGARAFADAGSPGRSLA
ncbi:MAG: EscU/YscU/HrcU family type III secretion system export apparatus switch protein [Candidatus Accumulibacter propinquus]